MKKIVLFIYTLCIVFSFSGCAAIGGIFKAGVWVGILIVAAIIGVIMFFVSRGSNKG